MEPHLEWSGWGEEVISEVAGGVDAGIGGVIEDANRNHHRRRLARVDWDQAFRGEDRGWASRRPLREGNDLQVYVDGAAALPAIAAAVRGARSFVHIAGWTIARRRQ
jgi:phosphatidylserine/phosphatidylglycerophosphate/cardiolipin synthase-like enzyme